MPQRLLGGRYQVLNELGHGGMGIVYRALDRLTGEVVTLKRLRIPESPSGDSTGQAALAEEFRLVAALHHPNIVGVLDYGFDDARQPYFTMDLEEGAQTIVEAGRDRALAIQVELLAQMLRALVYLHLQGIVHRDVKPANVVVVRDAVKVLDFGLSLQRSAAGETAGDVSGTLGWIAPELLDGAAATPESDLFAAGLVAYELFTGRPAFPDEAPFEAQLALAEVALPRPGDVLDERIRPLLARMLERDPARRYARASDVIADLGRALGQALPEETVATRESVIQSAPLVGRGDELARLSTLLADAGRGRGGTWLVEGESGVGKSRLLDEVRTLALIESVPVVRALARSGGGPYHLWRDVVRHLVLRVDVDDGLASVLLALVPDLDILLDRAVVAAPRVDAEAWQRRLIDAVEELIRRQPVPTLVILEDLHWAGSESLRVLARLTRTTDELGVLILGSARVEEASELRQVVGETHVLPLRRLTTSEIAGLGEAMMGTAGCRDDVLALLARETEGLPFFIVEVVRALAESAGGLTEIGRTALPENVLSGGMRRVVRRRLERVPADAMDVLRTAAVIGREIDPQLMRALHSDVELERWTDACAHAVVLELEDQRWRFAHDKLREQLLADLPDDVRRGRHRTVAEAIEAVYPDAPQHVTALAHHWRRAGDRVREAEWAERAGRLALQSGACREAIVFVERALELRREEIGTSCEPEILTARTLPASWRPHAALDLSRRVDPESVGFHLGLLEAALTEAAHRLGNHLDCRRHGERALRYFGQHVPSTRLGWPLAAFRQLVLRLTQQAAGVHSADDRCRRVATEAARVQSRLTDMFFFSIDAAGVVWSSVRLVNQCEPTGPSPELARGYAVLALLAGCLPSARLVDAFTSRAIELAGTAASDQAWVLGRCAIPAMQLCRWGDADECLQRANALALAVGDSHLRAECLYMSLTHALYTGAFERAATLAAEVLTIAEPHDDVRGVAIAHQIQADVLVRLGRGAAAVPLYEASLRALDPTSAKTEVVWATGMLALAQLQAGNREAAQDLASRALNVLLEARPIAYWLQQSMAAIAEVFVTLLEEHARDVPGSRAALERSARQACRVLVRFSRRIPLGRAHAALWEGGRCWASGQERRARRHWTRAVRIAERIGTPWELARAHLELGRHFPADAEQRARHLRRASEIFGVLGCADAAMPGVASAQTHSV